MIDKTKTPDDTIRGLFSCARAIVNVRLTFGFFPLGLISNYVADSHLLTIML